jgi:CubicO group peptidase (beta-lactamase class C family)
MGLLGHVLARNAGKSYEALLTERVLKPAGMMDTSITLNASQKKRLSPPFDADGSPNANWDLPTLAGAGALRSTADDMLRFVRTAMATTGPSAKTYAFSYESRARAGGDNDMGLAWHINTTSKAVWHNGQTGGYHSFVGFLPGSGGVVVLTNTAVGQIDDAGAKLLARLHGKPAKPQELKTSVKLKAAALEPLVGAYPLAPQFVVNITRDGDRLFLQATGQPRFRLYASSPLEFHLRVVDARVTFDQPVGGKSPKLVLHQNGQDMPGVRQEKR